MQWLPRLLLCQWGESWEMSEREVRVWLMYEVRRKNKKSQAFARVICHIAVKERGLSVEVLSGSEIEDIADDALRRYPKICDARFR